MFRVGAPGDEARARLSAAVLANYLSRPGWYVGGLLQVDDFRPQLPGFASGELPAQVEEVPERADRAIVSVSVGQTIREVVRSAALAITHDRE